MAQSVTNQLTRDLFEAAGLSVCDLAKVDRLDLRDRLLPHLTLWKALRHRAVLRHKYSSTSWSRQLQMSVALAAADRIIQGAGPRRLGWIVEVDRGRYIGQADCHFLGRHEGLDLWYSALVGQYFGVADGVDRVLLLGSEGTQSSLIEARRRLAGEHTGCRMVGKPEVLY